MLGKRKWGDKREMKAYKKIRKEEYRKQKILEGLKEIERKAIASKEK